MDNNFKNIIGYEKIENNLWGNFINNNLHHCHLISGTKGNGKSIFVKKLAKRIISYNQKQEKNTNNHPDILIITAKSNKKNGQEKILIDDIRNIKKFTNLSSGISQNKVIIIDAIDNMNKNSYNALLKTIEEPNDNIFIFLINHNIGNISSTIKSRCNIIKIKNFNFEDWSLIIKKECNNISEKDLKNLYLISPNSINEAIILKDNNWLDIYKKLILLLISSNELEIINFSKIMSSSETIFNIIVKIVYFLFIRIIKILSFKKINFILEEEGLLKNTNFSIRKIFLVQDQIDNMLRDLLIFNIDKRYFLLNIILLINSNFKNHVNH